MQNVTEDHAVVKSDHALDEQAAWPPRESSFLAVCETVFGDSISIWIDEPTGRAERSLAAAREALRRAHGAREGAATNWKTEAERELSAAAEALDNIPLDERGRVLRTIVAGLRDDVAELRAVLAGER